MQFLWGGVGRWGGTSEGEEEEEEEEGSREKSRVN